MNKLSKPRFLSNGFTLIELLVVIAIIGILSTMILTALSRTRTKTKDTRIISNVRQMSIVMQNHYDRVGKYSLGPGVGAGGAHVDTCFTAAGTDFIPCTSKTVTGDADATSAINKIASDICNLNKGCTATASGLTIWANNNQYAAWAKLSPFDYSNWFCVDSFGNAGIYTSNDGPTNTLNSSAHRLCSSD
ncbi:TPA: type II secretion system protein [Candidatus Berkelbacteria bacterium]|uniref:Uncharacterized protein n=1 Tax=Berkelbacteria bacterium GW2011_GWE1_39_12 TaxID=1618337 RepID=A0A0G4B2U4_9BACT|nr:MAG: hypothetical protein UT28_C0001G0076 [Berkelbacteria bacterium GW2011_GWE1_39_12]HBO60469.1 type II secretion system protein [Candidatus Berkelbacteria bacterium]